MASRLRHIGLRKESWVVLALDFSPESDALGYWSRLLDRASSLLAGVKVGLPAMLRLGPEGVRELSSAFRGDLYFLADFKLADIGDVVAEELRLLAGLGFDGAIVHLFPRCLEKASAGGLDAYGLVSMTCPSSLVDLHMGELLDYAASLDLAGVVVAATKPEAVRRARLRLGDKLILSPGVGAQGARPSSALLAGADFEIVGRSVVLARDPVAELASIVEAQRVVRRGG